MTKSSDARQNFVGGFRPHEGLGVLVGVSDVGPDGVPERLRVAMDPAPQLFLGEQGKPALHQIEPGGAGRREVHMEARSLEQPPADHGGLMRPIVVEDEMHVQLSRDRGLNRVEELPEFLRALPLVQLPDHLARLHVQSRKQRGRPVASIVVRATLDLAGTHRQQRPCPVQRLNLGLLIHTQHQRFVRWIQVQTDDIPDLLDEERILGEFEGLGPMRLEPEGAPDAADRTLAEPAGLRHRARTPVRRIAGQRLQCAGDHALDIGVRDRPRGPGARVIQQAVQPLAQKACPPFAHRRPGHPETGGDGRIRLPVPTGQDDARALRQGLGGPWAPGPLLEGGAFRHGQRQGREGTTESHGDLRSEAP